MHLQCAREQINNWLEVTLHSTDMQYKNLNKIYFVIVHNYICLF